MELEIKTGAVETEVKPTDVAKKMMEKIVVFLNKYGANPDTVKDIIAQVAPKIEEMAKKEESSTDKTKTEDTTDTTDAKKTEEKSIVEENIEITKDDKKPTDLQSVLNSLCK